MEPRWSRRRGAKTLTSSARRYYLNKLQSLETEHPAVGDVFVTLNPSAPPKPSAIVSAWRTSHPVPSSASRRAAAQVDCIQGDGGLWFAGAYLGYGFHEDGTKAGVSPHHTPCSLLLGSLDPSQPHLTRFAAP